MVQEPNLIVLSEELSCPVWAMSKNGLGIRTPLIP
jgi:hypothetical protein